MSCSGAVRIETGARHVDLQGRLNRELFYQFGIFLRFKISKENIGQKEFLFVVPIEVFRIYFFVATERMIDLIKIPLDHAVPRDLFHLRSVGQILVAEFAIVFSHLNILVPEFTSELVQVESNGEARAVADEKAALAVVDISTRPRHENAPLVLLFLAFGIHSDTHQLLIRETPDQHQEEC